MSDDKENNTIEEKKVVDANTASFMRPPKHVKDKTIFYKYSGYLKDLIGEEKHNGSMGK
jgi:hypothetical protein